MTITEIFMLKSRSGTSSASGTTLPGQFSGKGRRRISVSILIILAVLTVPVAALTWDTGTVDSGFRYGPGTSLKVDSDGDPHISYMNMSGEWSIRYANKTGPSWTKTTIDIAGNDTVMVSQATSLALDSAGNPRISYYNATNGNLRYAALNGGLWTKSVADDNNPFHFYNDRGAESALALYSSGYPGIAYEHYNAGHPELKYAWWDGSAWHNTTAPGWHIGHYNSLAIDSSGTAHISTTNSTGLYYLTWNGVSWTSTTVDNSCEARYTSIALDHSGNPRISYYDYTHHILKFAEKDAGSWTPTTVSAVNYAGYYSSLALDKSDRPHISYLDGTGVLMFASKNESSWDLETVDSSSGAVGYYTSLAIDSSNRPHIAYTDFVTGALKYTVGTPLSSPSRVGVFRNSSHQFYLDLNGNGAWSGATTDALYNFGGSGDIPVSGDWNADGVSEIGVFRNSTHQFYLDLNGNGAWNGAATDKLVSFGNSGDIPVTGDWNHDGTTEIGAFRNTTHTFYLDSNGNGVWNGAATDKLINFGSSGDIPITGDWNNDGTTEIGTFRNSTHQFYLDLNGNGAWNGAATDKLVNFGSSGDIPVTGDWNADGVSEIGAFRRSTHLFYLDYNGNGAWNGGTTDRLYNFGGSTDTPISGKWG